MGLQLVHISVVSWLLTLSTLYYHGFNITNSWLPWDLCCATNTCMYSTIRFHVAIEVTNPTGRAWVVVTLSLNVRVHVAFQHFLIPWVAVKQARVVVILSLKYCQIALNIAFQQFLPGGKTRLSGGWSQPLPTSVGRTLGEATPVAKCLISTSVPTNQKAEPQWCLPACLALKFT